MLPDVREPKQLGGWLKDGHSPLHDYVKHSFDISVRGGPHRVVEKLRARPVEPGQIEVLSTRSGDHAREQKLAGDPQGGDLFVVPELRREEARQGSTSLFLA